MKTKLALGFILIGFGMLAQNLIPNPGFEDKLGCPLNISTSFDSIKDWEQLPNHGGSADFFHECGYFPTIKVPNTAFGHQQAKTGSGIVGLTLWELGTEFREYIQIQLNSPLEKGKKYNLQVNVSLANDASYACNNLGFFFTTGSLAGTGDKNVIPITPTIENITNITDTAGWQTLNLEFTADQNYDHVTIGNFKSEQNSIVQALNQGFKSLSYVFLDDLSLEKIECDSLPPYKQWLCWDSTMVLSAPKIDSLYSYEWSNGENNESILVSETGLYWVKTNTGLCTHIDSIQIDSGLCVDVLSKQNVFTPNGDGKNDFFTPIYATYFAFESSELTIYNRWGLKVIELNGLPVGWNGFNEEGTIEKAGIYFYTWTYKIYPNDPIKKQSGFFYLVR